METREWANLRVGSYVCCEAALKIQSLGSQGRNRNITYPAENLPPYENKFDNDIGVQTLQTYMDPNYDW